MRRRSRSPLRLRAPSRSPRRGSAFRPRRGRRRRAPRLRERVRASRDRRRRSVGRRRPRRPRDRTPWPCLRSHGPRIRRGRRASRAPARGRAGRGAGARGGASRARPPIRRGSRARPRPATSPCVQRRRGHRAAGRARSPLAGGEDAFGVVEPPGSPAQPLVRLRSLGSGDRRLERCAGFAPAAVAQRRPAGRGRVERGRPSGVRHRARIVPRKRRSGEVASEAASPESAL